MSKTCPPTVSIDNLRGKAQGVTMMPEGLAKPAPAKPSNKLPAMVTAQAKPMAKPAPAKPSNKVPTASHLTPYGVTK